MKLTTDQQKYLKEYLGGYLDYRETCAEFYDHIVTALENTPENISFNTALNNIIDKDFGGLANIPVIEARYRQTTLWEMKKRYWNYIKACFKFPLAGIFIISSVIGYFLVKQVWFNFPMFVWIGIAMSLTNSLLNYIWYIKQGYVVWFGYLFNRTKRSVKDNGFILLRSSPTPVLILWAIVHQFFIKDTPAEWFKNASPLVLTLILTAGAIHILSFYKVHRDEYKVNIAA